MAGSRGDRRGDKVHKVRGFWLEVLDPWYKERELSKRQAQPRELGTRYTHHRKKHKMSPWDEACPGSLGTWRAYMCTHKHTNTYKHTKVPWGGQQSPRENQPPSSELKPRGVRQGSEKSPLPVGWR